MPEVQVTVLIVSPRRIEGAGHSRYRRCYVANSVFDARSHCIFFVYCITATVHNNGSNINAAMNLLDDWSDQRFFVHTLKLAICTGLKVKAIATMLGAAWRIAAHFKRSTVAAQALHDKQKAFQNDNTIGVSGMIIDCSKR